jgi:hypothetical protein
LGGRCRPCSRGCSRGCDELIQSRHLIRVTKIPGELPVVGGAVRPRDMTKRGVAGALARRAWDYLRNDLREIVWPRPMPDPPGKFPRISSMSAGEHLACWWDGITSYVDGWRWYNGEPKREREARLERERRERIARGEAEAAADAGRAEWDQDLDGVAEELEGMLKAGKRVGLEAWKVQFKHFYKTRMAAYREGVKEFIEGYKEGRAEALKPVELTEEEKEEARAEAALIAAELARRREARMAEETKQRAVQSPDDIAAGSRAHTERSSI